MSLFILDYCQSIWLIIRSFLLTLPWGSILLGLSLFNFVKWVKATPRNRFPPGPRGIPVFGNAFQLGPMPWHTGVFGEWNKIYGPMVYLNLAGQHMLILNDPKIASDLLDRRASIYSDRPRNVVAGEILTRGMLLPLTRYGDLWRRMRRAAQEALSKATVPMYHPVQECEAIILAEELAKDPENWSRHVQRAGASATVSTVYDMRPLESMSDPSVVTVNDMVNRVARAAAPGAHLVEIFHILNYIPRSLAKWKREADDWFSAYSKVFESRYTEIKTRVSSGEEQRPCFCARLAETSSRHNMTDSEASWLAATMYVGGADTLASTFAWFILASMAFPETQRKAQAELDEVVGRARLPSFSDWDHLPYVRALVKEVLRWRPSVPLAIPHAPIEDDWYEGYLIPKGTICFGNIWAMNQNTDFFGPDAADFNPSRHLDAQGQLKPSPETKHDGHFSFGFGRRNCVGRVVANHSAFIHIATMLWALKMEPPKDANGEYVQPDINAFRNEGLIIRPPLFKCTITPRFPDVESILQQAKDEAMGKRDMGLHVVKPITINPC